MVDIVSGSGLSRILTRNEVQEDTVVRQNLLHATEAAARREELARATALRRPDPVLGAGVGSAQAVDRELPTDSANRFPRLATFIADPASVNRILEDSQGVDRIPTAAERLGQAAVINDSFRRSFFISMIDPGRAMTMLGTRETYGLDDDT